MRLVSLKSVRESLKLKGHPPITRETIYSILRRMEETGKAEGKKPIKIILKEGGKPKRKKAHVTVADASRIRQEFTKIHWRQA